MYNKFVNNSIWNDDEAENAEEEVISYPTDFSGYVGYVEDIDSKSASKFDFWRSTWRSGISGVSDYTFVICDKTVSFMSNMYGYPRNYIKRCLDINAANYCTTLYYLMLSDQNY